MSEGIYDTSNGRCNAWITIQGTTSRCDLAIEHDGWAHSSKIAEAIWKGHENDDEDG